MANKGIIVGLVCVAVLASVCIPWGVYATDDIAEATVTTTTAVTTTAATERTTAATTTSEAVTTTTTTVDTMFSANNAAVTSTTQSPTTTTTVVTKPPVTKEKTEKRFCWPLPQGREAISSGYGYRWGNFHRGVDMVAAMGDPVVAVADGTVIACEGRAYNGGYGMTVTIDHGNGLHTRYAHLDSVTVTVGDAVTTGQTIAAVGMTGETTGPCLHFEVHVNGDAVDPLAYLA